MEDLYEELAPIQFTEAKRRCAAVMCLVNNSGDITNREIQNATGITMKTILDTQDCWAGKSEIPPPDIHRISGGGRKDLLRFLTNERRAQGSKDLTK